MVVSRLTSLILAVFSWKRDRVSYLSRSSRVKCRDEVTIGTNANLSSSYLNKCRYKSNYRLGRAMAIHVYIYIFVAELLIEGKYAETRIVFQLRPEIKSAY